MLRSGFLEPADQAGDFFGVEPAMADRFAFENQYRNFEPVPRPQLLVGVDVDHANVHGPSGAETLELDQHFIAQLAPLARNDGEANQEERCERAALDYGARPLIARGTSSPGFTELAMNCTVCAGTSPTAVTWWPLTVREKV